jgi:hypothetical protein
VIGLGLVSFSPGLAPFLTVMERIAEEDFLLLPLEGALALLFSNSE